MEGRAHPTLPLYHISSDSWEMNTPGRDHTRAALGCFPHPTPQINITLCIPRDYQLPSGTSASPGVPAVQIHNKPTFHRCWGAEREGVRPASPQLCPQKFPALLSLGKLLEKWSSTEAPGHCLHLQRMETGASHFQKVTPPSGRPSSLAGGGQDSGLMKEISRRMIWGTLLHFRAISRCETPTSRQPSYQQGPESPQDSLGAGPGLLLGQDREEDITTLGTYNVGVLSRKMLLWLSSQMEIHCLRTKETMIWGIFPKMAPSVHTCP